MLRRRIMLLGRNFNSSIISLWVVATLCKQPYTYSLFQPERENTWILLESRLQSKEDIIVFTGGNYKNQSFLWLKMSLRNKYTLWTVCGDGFRDVTEKDTLSYGRSTILVLGGFNETKKCLQKDSNKNWLYSADFVLFPKNNDRNAIIQGLLNPSKRYSVCFGETFSEHPATFTKKNSSTPTARLVSRNCASYKTPERLGWRASLSGSTIKFGCFDVRAYGLLYNNSCQEPEFEIFLLALRALNVSLEFQTCKDHTNWRLSVRDCNADILMHHFPVQDWLFGMHRAPSSLEYQPETFYTWKGKAEVSFVYILLHSKGAFAVVLISMTVFGLTLLLLHYTEFGGSGAKKYLLDLVFFICASFLSTGAPMSGGLTRTRGRYVFTQCKRMLLGFWLLSVFPVSFYFRGELTSHIAVKIDPNPIDTISELEAALSKSAILPCVVNGTETHLTLESKDFGNSSALLTRLRLAFHRNAGITRLTFLTYSDCIRRCAWRPGFVCLSYTLAPCGMYLTGMIAESKEILRLAFFATPVRRDFPKALAYGRLLSRIFESSLNIESFTHPLMCSEFTITPSHVKNRETLENEPTVKLTQLKPFFGVLYTLFLLSHIAFCIEVMFPRTNYI